MVAVLMAALAIATTAAHRFKSASPTHHIDIATPSPATCTSTQCVDYVNTCGQMYGGCFPVCGHYTIPQYTDPGCTTLTTAATTTEARIAALSTSSCDSTVCVDKINDCGIRYGACYADCAGYATPTFTVPDCPTTSARVTAVIAAVTETDFAIIDLVTSTSA